MDRDKVLEQLWELERMTQQPAVAAVRHLIEDGRPVDQSLMEGFVAVVNALAMAHEQLVELRMSQPSPTMVVWPK